MTNVLNQNIINELGIDNLEPEKQMEIIGKVGQVIFQGVLMRVLDVLDDDDQEKLNNLLDLGDGDELLVFLQTKVPDLDEIVREETTKFKEQSLDFMDQIQ